MNNIIDVFKNKRSAPRGLLERLLELFFIKAFQDLNSRFYRNNLTLSLNQTPRQFSVRLGMGVECACWQETH